MVCIQPRAVSVVRPRNDAQQLILAKGQLVGVLALVGVERPDDPVVRHLAAQQVRAVRTAQSANSARKGGAF